MGDQSTENLAREPDVTTADEFAWLPPDVASEILSIVSDGILITSREGVILQANDSFSRLSQHERWELEGASIALVAAATEDPAAEIAALLGDDDLWAGVTQIRRADGRLIECDTWIRALDADEGAWWVSVHRRTNARRRYGTTTVDEVSATAHDLVNSVASLRGYVALLDRASAAQSAEILDRLRSVTETTTIRLERLVAELRGGDGSRPQSRNADTVEG